MLNFPVNKKGNINFGIKQILATCFI